MVLKIVIKNLLWWIWFDIWKIRLCLAHYLNTWIFEYYIFSKMKSQMGLYIAIVLFKGWPHWWKSINSHTQWKGSTKSWTMISRGTVFKIEKNHQNINALLSTNLIFSLLIIQYTALLYMYIILLWLDYKIATCSLSLLLFTLLSKGTYSLFTIFNIPTYQ